MNYIRIIVIMSESLHLYQKVTQNALHTRTGNQGFPDLYIRKALDMLHLYLCELIYFSMNQEEYFCYVTLMMAGTQSTLQKRVKENKSFFKIILTLRLLSIQQIVGFMLHLRTYI